MSTDRRYIGSADIATIAELNPYETPLQLWERLMHGKTQPATAAMERGTTLQPYVAQLASSMLAEKLKPGITVVHPKYEFVRATPDYIASPSRRIVECKTHREGLRDMYGQDTDAVPAHEVVQVTYQRLVLAAARRHVSREMCLAVAFVSDTARVTGRIPVGVTDFTTYALEYDQELGDMLLELAVKWWERHVVKGEMPEPTGADVHVMRRLFPQSTSRELVADTTAANDAILLRAIVQAQDTLDKMRDELTVRLQHAMQDADTLVTPVGKIVWRTRAGQTRRVVDFDTLQAKYPDAYAECVKTVTAEPTRPFVIPKSWRETNDEYRQHIYRTLCGSHASDSGPNSADPPADTAGSGTTLPAECYQLPAGSNDTGIGK